MQQILAWVIALGSLLVVSWIFTTGLALNWRFVNFAPSHFDSQWRAMVLGFFASQSAPVVLAWWFTACVSTVGWLMGLAAVWPAAADSDVIVDDKAGLYLQMCAAQLGILLVWTAILLYVKPSLPLIWRQICVSLLFAVTVVYVATVWAFLEARPDHLVAVVFLCVHAAHGFFWDLILWGRSYLLFDKNGSAPASTQQPPGAQRTMVTTMMMQVDRIERMPLISGVY